MLVLTRGKGESILIGDDVEITVVEIRGDKIRLGIQAPSGVSVHRKEVYLQIRQANVEAAQADPGGVARLGEIKPALPKTVDPDQGKSPPSTKS